MPAILANATKFLQNSDYPFDKVVYVGGGDYMVNASSNGTATLAHGLPFTPLVSGNWSLTSDFSVTYEYGSGVFPSSNPGYVFDTSTNIYADGTNIYFSTDNVSASQIHVYVRAFALQPTTDDSAITPLSGAGSAYRLNTTYNNSKLFTSGYVDLPDGGGSGTTYQITHPLGYVPQVMGWTEANGYTHTVYSTNSLASSTQLTANELQISWIIKAGTVAQRAHYRIYMDRQF